jgi:hypothetical protein
MEQLTSSTAASRSAVLDLTVQRGYWNPVACADRMALDNRPSGGSGTVHNPRPTRNKS